MKEIVSSLKETALSRIKNPLIGTFIASWLVVHSKEILIFTLQAREYKLKMLNEYNFDFQYDFLFPFYLTIGYLFFIPLFQLIYEYIHSKYITKNREKITHSSLRYSYENQKKTNSLKIEADENVIKELKLKEIELWQSEKTQFSKVIINLKSIISQLNNDIQSSKISSRNLANDHEKEVKRLQADKRMLKSDVNNLVEMENKFHDSYSSYKLGLNGFAPLKGNDYSHLANMTSDDLVLYIKNTDELIENLHSNVVFSQEDIPF